PRFFAWIQGTGTVSGFLADMLASAMNPNVTIGEQIPMYVDQQVVDWCKEMLGFPTEASGILVSGGSMANITCLTVARNTKLGTDFREKGYAGIQRHPVFYCSSEVHSCVYKAAEILGIGRVNVRKIPVNDEFELIVEKLETAIKEDLNKGYFPFCVVATTGTVNSGAIDPLEDIYRICQTYDLWMHIDGAYGALAKLDDHYADRLKYIEYADSVAFDLHKWLYVNYEVGCALIRRKEDHRNAFAITPNYLLPANRGLAGGPDSINNYGFELSRGFKALKVWMSIKEHGLDKYKAIISQNDRQAEFLGRLIANSPFLELVAPVSMSIVCYRYVQVGLSEDELNALNQELLILMQEEGIASPSSTVLNGVFCIRVCIVNHRTKNQDLVALFNTSILLGAQLTEGNSY
ncbi:MAG: aminotransferase class V-fold PLP-dependent enzyme, partial [Bacteroidota bacterium]